MDTALKQRLWGAAVLAALAIIFLPMLLKSPDVKTPDAAQVPLDMPASPDGKFETRELPLVEPSTTTPPDGVLGMPTQPAPDAAGNAGIAAASSASAPAAAPMVPAGSAANTPATAPAPAPAVPTPPVAGPKTPAAPAAASKPVTAPSAAPPAAPSTPATAAGGYAVSVGSFGNLANANALVTRLRAARLPVMTDKVSVNGGTAMRIRIGPFADRTAAEAARLRADGVTGGGGKVVAMDAAPVAPAAPSPAAAPAGAKALAAPAPAPAPRPSAVASGFAVQLSAPASEADANALRDRARAQGLNCFVQRVDTEQGARFRVRVGPVADRTAAETLRATVQQKLGIAGNIVTHP